MFSLSGFILLLDFRFSVAFINSSIHLIVCNVNDDDDDTNTQRNFEE